MLNTVDFFIFLFYFMHPNVVILFHHESMILSRSWFIEITATCENRWYACATAPVRGHRGSGRRWRGERFRCSPEFGGDFALGSSALRESTFTPRYAYESFLDGAQSVRRVSIYFCWEIASRFMTNAVARDGVTRREPLLSLSAHDETRWY